MKIFRKLAEPFTQHPTKAAANVMLKCREKELENDLNLAIFNKKNTHFFSAYLETAKCVWGSAFYSGRMLLNGIQFIALPTKPRKQMIGKLLDGSVSPHARVAENLLMKKPELFQDGYGEWVFNEWIVKHHTERMNKSQAEINKLNNQIKEHRAIICKEWKNIEDCKCFLASGTADNKK
jgi:hypothetical protein